MSEVVDFTAKKEEAENLTPEQELAKVAKKNAENKKRMEDERAKANKGVLRSYRIK